MIYSVRIPFFLKLLFPGALTRVPTAEKTIYLTFDDGPVPEVTPWVLSQLKAYHAQATFFCIGDNVHKHREIYNTVLADGHSVGNHTFNHLNGWKTPLQKYLDNTAQCARDVESNLFRPPYGRITFSQYRSLKNFYTIVLWDVLSGDFDPATAPEACLQQVLKNTRNGSVIVFHDSIKASTNLYYTLPKVLAYYSQQGYSFKALPILKKQG